MALSDLLCVYVPWRKYSFSFCIILNLLWFFLVCGGPIILCAYVCVYILLRILIKWNYVKACSVAICGVGIGQLAVGVTVGLILNDDITLRGVRELWIFLACVWHVVGAWCRLAVVLICWIIAWDCCMVNVMQMLLLCYSTDHLI